MPLRCDVILVRDETPHRLCMSGSTDVEMCERQDGRSWCPAYMWAAVKDTVEGSNVLVSMDEGSTLVKSYGRYGHRLLGSIFGCPDGMVVRLCDLDEWNAVGRV